MNRPARRLPRSSARRPPRARLAPLAPPVRLAPQVPRVRPVRPRLRRPPASWSGSAQWRKSEPNAAILAAYAEVEKAVRGSVSDLAVPRDAPLTYLLAAAIADQRIQAPTANSVKGLAVLRNLAAHSPETGETQERAMDFLAMADATLFAIRSNLARRRSTLALGA